MNKLAYKYLIASIGVMVLSVIVLLLMGRVAICECGYVKLWHGVVMSSENSQHISDWYTFTHIIHGFGFYLLLLLINKKWRMSLGLMMVLAVMLESAWEVFENTDMIINRYREVTISLDYYGDSVINVIGDIAAMIIGFWLARKLPAWLTFMIFILIEGLLIYFIRDSLILNLIMLIYPNETILNWQSGT
jgi:hypothetical protein